MDILKLDLTDKQQQLVKRVDQLAREKIAPRAARYDRETELPWEDLQDLHREGWLLAALEEERGGLGYGLYQTDPVSFYLIIEHLARVNPSTAHCFQVHNNCLQMVSFFSTDEQRERFVKPTRERGALLVGAGSEPPPPKDGAPPSDRLLRTTVRPVDGGVIVTGQKHYMTNAPGAEWIWCLGLLEETGKDLMLMIHRNSPGVEIDDSFWDPVGMRPCVSPIGHFRDCFVPQENILGKPGDFIGNQWLNRINFGFTANYLGALEGMYDWLVGYLGERGRAGDPFSQAGIGELRSRIHAAKLLFYHSISLFRTNEAHSTRLAHEAKWVAVDALQRFIYLGGQVAGSTAFFYKHPLQRLVRDMQVHMLHSRHHVVAQMIGQEELGEASKPEMLRQAVGL